MIENNNIASILDGLQETKGLDVEFEPVGFPVAVPMQMCIDSDSYLITEKNGQGRWFLKILSIDGIRDIDIEGAIGASERAGQIGVGARVAGASAAQGAILFEYLSNYRAAFIDDFDNSEVTRKTVELMRVWHRDGVPAQHEGPLEIARRFQDVMQSGSVNGHAIHPSDDFPIISDSVGRIFEALLQRPPPSVPLRGENAVSNVMIDKNKSVRLVDFDRSIYGDPAYDLGALSSEICTTEEEVDQLCSLYGANVSPTRVKLYKIIDDFIWGCWRKISHFASPRRDSIEFYKFGENRLVQCAHYLKAWGSDRLIGQLDTSKNLAFW